jgi:regulator of replication initiation timing
MGDSKIDTKILEKLRSAQQKAGELSLKVKDLTIENEKLKKELAEMKAKKPRS